MNSTRTNLSLCVFYLVLFIFRLPTLASSDCPTTLVSYHLTVYTFWTQQAFPKHYPDTRPVPQWSKLYGVSHDDNLTLFQVGTAASKPLQQYAELGRADEFEATLNHSQVLSQFYAPPIKKGMGVTSTTFFVDGKHTKISFVMKIHPSPDWFVGVDRLSLCQNGIWIENSTIDASPMDAGTDQGFTFTSPDYANEDAEPVYTINSTYPREPYGSFYYRNLTQLPLMAQFVVSKVKEYELKSEQSVLSTEACLDLESTLKNISKALLNATSDKKPVNVSQELKEKVNVTLNEEKQGKHQSIVLNVEAVTSNALGHDNSTTSKQVTQTSKQSDRLINETHNTKSQMETILANVEAISVASAEKIARTSGETSSEFHLRRKKRKTRRYMKSMIEILNQMLNEDENNGMKDKEVGKERDDKGGSKSDKKDTKGTSVIENSNKDKGTNSKGKETKKVSKNSKPSTRKKSNTNNKGRQEQSKPKKEGT